MALLNISSDYHFIKMQIEKKEIRIGEGLNIGTSGNDIFYSSTALKNFELDGGDGYDIARLDLGLTLAWQADNIEAYEFSGHSEKSLDQRFGNKNKPVQLNYEKTTSVGKIQINATDSTAFGNGKIEINAKNSTFVQKFDMTTGEYLAQVNNRDINNIYLNFTSIITGKGDDNIFGSNKNDQVELDAGHNFFDGREGLDTLRIAMPHREFSIQRNENKISIANLNSTLNWTYKTIDVERVEFTVKVSSTDPSILAFDLDGAAGQTYRLYQAAFARTPDTVGLGHNVKLVDGGMSLHQMSSAFIGSTEFIQRYGASTTDTVYINALYNNVLGRDADAGGLAGWLNRLSTGEWNRPGVLIGFSESAENKALVGSAIENGIWLG